MKMRCLVIEDEPSVARSVARMLRRVFPGRTIIIVGADTAADAIAALTLNRFDFVLSDYDLRRGNGGDVLAWLRGAKPELVSRFVFQTGNDVVTQLHDRYVLKPYTHAELGQALAGVVELG